MILDFFGWFVMPLLVGLGALVFLSGITLFALLAGGPRTARFLPIIVERCERPILRARRAAEAALASVRGFAQRSVLLVGVAALTALAACPPWTAHYGFALSQVGSESRPIGHYWLFSPPSPLAAVEYPQGMKNGLGREMRGNDIPAWPYPYIDFGQLALEWVMVVGATSIVFILLRRQSTVRTPADRG